MQHYFTKICWTWQKVGNNKLVNSILGNMEIYYEMGTTWEWKISSDALKLEKEISAMN
jgi:hypothetical protein